MKTIAETKKQENQTKKAEVFYWFIPTLALLLSAVFLFLVNAAKAATYYYISGEINNVNSWKTGSDGTGTSPSSFLVGTNTFIVWNSISASISPTLTGTWNFGGSNILQIGTSTGSATLVIGSGTLNLQGSAILRVGPLNGTSPKQLFISNNGILNITSSATLPLRVRSNGTLTIASTTFPTAAQVALNAGSWVEWAQNSAVTIWQKTYPNMIISGTGIKAHSGTGTLGISGQLVMQSGGLQMSVNTGATLQLSGTITGTAPIIPANSNLTISGSGPFGTIYFASPYQIRNLSVNRAALGQITLGSNLTVNGTTNFSNGNIHLNNNTLTLNGAITFPTAATNGYFTGSLTSNLIIGGSGGITNGLRFNQSTNTTRAVYNLTMNRGGRTLNLRDTLHIWGSLTASNGTINCGSNLCFIKASNNLKGRVGPIGSTADITGSLTVEVYAKGGTTGYAMLGVAGVTGKTFADWNDDFTITCPACPNGSVVGGVPFTSVYAYSEPAVTNCYSCAAHYVPINSISDPITVGKGYYVYLGTSTYTTSDIVIDVTGALVKKSFGTLSLTRTGTVNPQNGWNLIANPYPSPISFTAAFSSYSTQIQYAVYVFNPDLNGGNGEHAVYIPGVGSIPSVANGGIDDNIPMGQGMFIRARNPISITPSEAWKTATANTNPLLRTFPNTNNSSSYPSTLFLLNLKGSTQNFNTYTGINMNPAATYTFDNGLDATHIPSDYDYNGRKIAEIYTEYNGTLYKCNSIPLIAGTFTTNVYVHAGYSGTYTISPININNFPQGACISLYDRFTNTTHDLKTGDYVFSFSDTTNVARFVLSINYNPLSASGVVSQAATCKKSNDAQAVVTITGTPPFKIVWKDSTNTIITTHTTTAQFDTLKNRNAGLYYADVSSMTGCSGSLVSFNINYTTPLPIASANLLSPSTLSCNLSNPFVFSNSSANASSYYWLVLGNGTSSTSSTTFTCMPQDTGHYLVRLYAFNSCNDTSFTDIPIRVTPGPDMNIPYFYGPCPQFMPGCQTARTTSQTDTSINLFSLFHDASGYYLIAYEDTEIQLTLSDVLGRIIYQGNEVLKKQEKKYLPIDNNHQQWMILKAITTYQKMHTKIWIE